MTGAYARPTVLVTGAAGNLGRSVAAALADGYRIVGLDRHPREEGPDGSHPILAMGLGSDESVALAMLAFRSAHEPRIASVMHLAAYFDFTGEDNPLYQSVNVDSNCRACSRTSSRPTPRPRGNMAAPAWAWPSRGGWRC